MPTRETVQDFLSQSHVAFVGVSRNPKQFANGVYRRLREGGRVLYPVNRAEEATTIEGDVAYRRLADVPEPVEAALLMVPPAAEPDLVRQAIERGITRIWLHRSSNRAPISAEVGHMCEEAGVELVDGACPLMFLEPVRSVHGLHRAIARKRFAA